MTNNDILKKLRIALQLRNDDIMKILGLVDFKISESELSAVFRAEDHENYRECGDQLLRNFLNGLIIYKRGPMDPKADTDPEALSERTKYDTPKPEYIKSTPKKVLIIKKKQEDPERRKVFLKKKTEGETEDGLYNE